MTSSCLARRAATFRWPWRPHPKSLPGASRPPSSRIIALRVLCRDLAWPCQLEVTSNFTRSKRMFCVGSMNRNSRKHEENNKTMIAIKSRNRCGSCAARPAPDRNVQVEWAQINDRQVVVATEDRMWVHELDQNGEQDPFAEPMDGPGSLATTRQLLEAAWCAGFPGADSNRVAPRKSLPRYVWELIGFYHSTSNTPQTLTEAAARFREADRSDLDTFARRFARLEAGDEKMAVADLEALGYQAEALIRCCPPPPSTVASVDRYRSLARGPEPIEVFGYCYALERASLALN